MFWKFSRYSILQEDNTTKNISVHISSSKFYKKYYYIWLSNGVNVKLVHSVLKVHSTFQVLLQFLDPQFHRQGLLNFLGGVYVACNFG